MPIDDQTAAKLRKRVHDIEQWLGDEAPYAFSDQRHLVEHTPEQAYWHYGYWAALRDVLNLAETCASASGDSEGK